MGMVPVAWAKVVAVVALHCIAISCADVTESSVTLLEESETNPMLPALHGKNAMLLNQIKHVEGGGGLPLPGEASPGDGAMPGAGAMPAMPAMPAMGPAGPTAGGDERMAGIKEALTAVKPVMDKYVHTAKTLTGKYAALKEAYTKLKTSGKTDPALEARFNNKIKDIEAADVTKYNKLEEKYEDVQKEEAASKATDGKTKIQLQQEIASLKTTNKQVAASFETELEKARKSAKGEVVDMRNELNRFMEDANKDTFDELGEATSKATEEKKTLLLKAPLVKSEIHKMLEAEAKKDEMKDQSEWGSEKKESDKKGGEGYGDDEATESSMTTSE